MSTFSSIPATSPDLVTLNAPCPQCGCMLEAKYQTKGPQGFDVNLCKCCAVVCVVTDDKQALRELSEDEFASMPIEGKVIVLDQQDRIRKEKAGVLATHSERHQSMLGWVGRAITSIEQKDYLKGMAQASIACALGIGDIANVFERLSRQLRGIGITQVPIPISGSLPPPGSPKS